ncbi:MAG: 4-(cytidine 5'-diphospho)-2-C-methyl-D-erythritol kinase [Zoogloeaceae bacterium]|nr:4-(cytidine 5'-diphospho)-2-C-methyl-D-erythritol kinase [Zoogloeaceae bacterium]
MGPGWTWESVWPAPAKLNLFLHVIGRRPDGYHRLQTLFRLLDFGDTLRFSPRDDGTIALANPLPGVSPEADLAVRAARLLQMETGARQGVTIHLEKRIPVGGGLGGGSSDAATTLIALNHLWDLGLSRKCLRILGLRLGADVPVFVLGRNAFAEGVGENLIPTVLPEAWYLILKPPVSIPTATIFAVPDLCRDTPPIRFSGWHPGFGRNDLEPVACRLYPEVAESLAWLRARARNATSCRMSGSGACVFAEFEREAEARILWEELPEGWRGWVVGGIRHPL